MACLATGTGVVGCSHTVRGGCSFSLRSEALFFPKVSVVRMGEAKGLSVKAMAVEPKFEGTQRREKHLTEMIEKKPNESSAKSCRNLKKL
ncbi:hypothetical protein SO802_014547 [Lithocarpus litseifolius]|uniref:Uncharacterized protein n=1 Tax=Lithocarpus litseifolius TaxID=425828 RepID=A0AAW2CUS8_9ROSI